MFSKRHFKTKDEVEVTFEMDRPDVSHVDLAGEWNGWRLEPMKRSGRGKGPFRLKRRLPQDGEFEFRYLLDGHAWENDDAADAYRPNGYGSDNSVIATRS